MLRITATDDSPAAVTASALLGVQIQDAGEATRWPNAETSSPQYGRVAKIACELDVGSNVGSSLRQFALLDPQGNPIDPANAGAYDEKGSHQVTFRMISTLSTSLMSSDGQLFISNAHDSSTLECGTLPEPFDVQVEATGSSDNPGAIRCHGNDKAGACYRRAAPSWVTVSQTQNGVTRELTPGALQVSINENSPAGTQITEEVYAVDPDGNGPPQTTLTYSMNAFTNPANTGKDLFSVSTNANGGAECCSFLNADQRVNMGEAVITVASGAILNFEDWDGQTQDSLQIIVDAQDGEPKTTVSQAIIINLIDVNDAPAHLMVLPWETAQRGGRS